MQALAQTADRGVGTAKAATRRVPQAVTRGGGMKGPPPEVTHPMSKGACQVLAQQRGQAPPRGGRAAVGGIPPARRRYEGS